MTEILVTDFVKGLLIFLRIIAVMFMAPVFSHNAVPNFAKMLLALALTYIIYFTIPGDVNYNPQDGIVLLAFMGFKEVLTGLIMGFVLTFIFHAVNFGGMLIGFDMGLSMAQAFDPNTEAESNVIGQILVMFAIVIFILINGHHYIVRGITASFKVIPLGFYTINESLFTLITKYSASIFVVAVKIASPLMVSFFLVHLSAGIIARVIPSMNVFFVLFPLKLGLGFLLIIASLPVIVYLLKSIMYSYENKLYDLIKVMSY